MRFRTVRRTLRVLIVSDKVYPRLLLWNVLSGSDRGLEVAISINEGLRRLRETEFDLVVIDLTDKEMNGEEFVMRAQLQGSAVPTIILAADFDDAMQRRLRQLEVAGFVAKPVDLRVFEAVFRKVLDGARGVYGVGRQVGNEQGWGGATADEEAGIEIVSAEEGDEAGATEARFSLLEQMMGTMPALPHLVTQILQLEKDPNTTVTQMADAIASDLGFSAKLLRLVNSSYYGFTRRIASIDQAVVILGFDAVRHVALSASVLDIFSGHGNFLDRQKLWEHSVGCAVGARVLAHAVADINPAVAFTAGLLHDIGRLILDEYLPDQMQMIIDVMRVGGVSALAAEQQVLNVTHAWLGSWLAEKWNLPERLVAVLEWHHEPEGAPVPHRLLAALVNAADVLCAMAGMGCGCDSMPPFLSPYTANTLRLSRATLEARVPIVRAETEEFMKVAPRQADEHGTPHKGQ